MTFIPPRYMPVDAVKVTDSVTGATYMRPRRLKKKNSDSEFQRHPKPATCTTPFCKWAGLPHDECKARDPFNPYYFYPYPAQYAHEAAPYYGYDYYWPTPYADPRYIPARSPAVAIEELSDSSGSPASSEHLSPFAPPRPLDDFDAGPVIPPRPIASPRHAAPVIPSRSAASPWYVPPVIPPWDSPRGFVPPRPSPSPQLSADENAFQRWLQSFPHWRIPREMPPDWRSAPPPEGRYTPYRAATNLPSPDPFDPAYAVPAATPISTIGGLQNRVPDRVEWDNVQGGRLQWTPHPWVAHPLPHPEIPANAFWNYPNTQQSWVGPGGSSPYYGLDADRMNLLTGGHPLPGMDRYWTPTRWVPPLPAQYPRYGALLSVWLAPNARNSFSPHILWDAAVQPTYLITRVTSRGNIVDFATTDFFKAQATYPPVKTLQVNLPHMRNSWGPVVIRKDSNITVGVVFNSVWEYLQTRLTRADYRAIYNTYGWEKCERIRWAYERRCWNSGSLYDYTKSQGLKRVDLLENECAYWGTYLTYNADWTWSLTMAFVPLGRMAN